MLNVVQALRKWLLRYYYWRSEIRHGDRPHNYVSNGIFGFAVSTGLTKILLIENCIFFRHTVHQLSSGKYICTVIYRRYLYTYRPDSFEIKLKILYSKLHGGGGTNWNKSVNIERMMFLREREWINKYKHPVMWIDWKYNFVRIHASRTSLYCKSKQCKPSSDDARIGNQR